MSDNNIVKINNSKKISELRGRDEITKHQDHSWIAIAQYNDKIGAYHNIALNISSITGYAIEQSAINSAYFLDEQIAYLVDAYSLSYTSQLSYWLGEYDYDKFSYVVNESQIAYNIISYTTQYTNNTVAWEYYPGVEFNNVRIKYLCGEDGVNLLTDTGKKIRVD